MRSRGSSSVLIAVLVATVLAIATTASAATFPIANGDVAGLKSAITTANTNNQADTINLASGGLYTLTALDNTDVGPTGLPSILADGGNALTINGNGAIIERSASAPVFRILLVAGSLTLRQVTLRGGSTESQSGYTDGGAIRVHAGTLALSDSTLTGNRAGLGGHGYGGGVGLRPGATAMITNCTISGNIANKGGGVSSDQNSTVVISNSTIAGNLADSFAGSAPDDSGGGVWVFTGSPPGSITLASTIVADNSATSGTGPDASGSLTSGGNNLIENPNGFTGTIASDQTGIEPGLGPLQDNGGPTWTEAITPASAAFDKGSNPLALSGDQRGLPRVSGAAADVGAFEYQLTDVPILSRDGLLLLAALVAAFAVILLRRHA